MCKFFHILYLVWNKYTRETFFWQKAELPVKINFAYLLREAARIIQDEESEIKKYVHQSSLDNLLIITFRVYEMFG